jgi:hypothetical protein
LDLPVKKKRQDEMSERFFGCKDMNRLVNKMDVTRAENAETPQRKGSTLSESKLLTKSVRPQKKHSVASSRRELDSMGLCCERELEIVEKQLVTMKRISNNQISLLNDKIKLLEEENGDLRDYISEANSRESSLVAELNLAMTDANQYKNRLHRSYSKIRQLKGISNLSEERDPNRVAEIILRHLSESDLTEEEVVESFISALCMEKKLQKHLPQAIISKSLPEVSSHYKNVMYQTLRWKVRPWVCLMELDKVATVSFRGYDDIRKIEFHGKDSKYKKGLFYSRMELGRLGRELEQYGEGILPFELTSNAVKFNILTAVHFILERYCLWDYVERKEEVITAATVDGGELAWKLTQISAGIKDNSEFYS